MFLNLFKLAANFVQRIFILLFTASDHKYEQIVSIDKSVWLKLAKPILHNNNTFSVFNYNDKLVSKALYYIKNKKDEKILNALCQILVDHLTEELFEQEIFNNFSSPIIVNIPSSRSHILRRGYNPSTLIAKKISQLSQIDFIENVIAKSKLTPEQKTLSRYERLKNMKNSMTIKNDHIPNIRNKCVIVVDDIMTTGATLKEARRVLLKNGAKKILGVVLAH